MVALAAADLRPGSRSADRADEGGVNRDLHAAPNGQGVGHNLQAAVVQHRRVEVNGRAGARSHQQRGLQLRGRSWQRCAPRAHCPSCAALTRRRARTPHDGPPRHPGRPDTSTPAH